MHGGAGSDGKNSFEGTVKFEGAVKRIRIGLALAGSLFC